MHKSTQTNLYTQVVRNNPAFLLGFRYSKLRSKTIHNPTHTHPSIHTYTYYVCLRMFHKHTPTYIHKPTQPYLYTHTHIHKRILYALARVSGTAFRAGADIPTSEII